MKISLEDVVRVAELAHLELLPGETEMYREQLDEILTYIDKLKELDMTNVEPMTQALSTTAAAGGGSESAHPELREDVLRPCAVAESVLSRAPDAAKPFFRVPKVIER
ncbi:MAG TPA: Asp-tRNA(Asn)/Glu-tRNA(Gln) amidotransferase subunit GatC [Candidatus Acidoferrales bacterium]|nr:Asp-tRNA(Asn)/Glu-tRNA(Gln) amidotransferase subunit GatC [Candidatus Acidoferrales bacterium]